MPNDLANSQDLLTSNAPFLSLNSSTIAFKSSVGILALFFLVTYAFVTSDLNLSLNLFITFLTSIDASVTVPSPFSNIVN